MLINPWTRIAEDLKALYFVFFFREVLAVVAPLANEEFKDQRWCFQLFQSLRIRSISKRRTIQDLRFGNTTTNTCFKQTQFLVGVKVHVSS